MLIFIAASLLGLLAYLAYGLPYKIIIFENFARIYISKLFTTTQILVNETSSIVLVKKISTRANVYHSRIKTSNANVLIYDYNDLWGSKTILEMYNSLIAMQNWDWEDELEA